MSAAVPRLHVDIPDDLHVRAKVAAAREHVTMKDLVQRAVELYVAQVEAKQERD